MERRTIYHLKEGEHVVITDTSNSEARMIMLDKLREMSNVTFDDCECAESYAMLCSEMCDIYKALMENNT